MRYSSTAAYWPDRPISGADRRAVGASTSMPATSARPASGCSSVVRTRTAVVLPAPFGPSRAEHGALGHVEVEPVEGPDGAVGLHQAFGDHCVSHAVHPSRSLLRGICFSIFNIDSSRLCKERRAELQAESAANGQSLTPTHADAGDAGLIAGAQRATLPAPDPTRPATSERAASAGPQTCSG